MRQQLPFILLFVSACSVVPEKEPSVTRAALVVGADDRVPLSPATVASSPALKAIGRVATAMGQGCTATKVANNYVLTAAHCFSRTSVPSSFFFYPGAVYDGTHGPLENYTGPRVSVVRLVRGAGGLSAPCVSFVECGAPALCENSRCTAFDTGSDFALVEVDPSSFANPSQAIPNWASVPSMALQSTGPILPSASAFGYPFHTTASGGFLTGQKGCSLIKRTPADGYDQAGLYKTNCDLDERMSGGPATFTTVGGWTETHILAIAGPDAGVLDAPESTNQACITASACDQSVYGQEAVCLWSRCGRRCGSDGDCGGGKCVRNLCRPACTPAFPLCATDSTCVNGACVRSDYPDTFTQLVDVFPAIHSPWDAVGLAASAHSDGRLNVTATDRARPNQLMMRTEAVDEPRPFDSWRDSRAGVPVPNPGRVSAVLYDVSDQRRREEVGSAV